jgi:spore coat polysaccharide biosynthesis protein SpsF
MVIAVPHMKTVAIIQARMGSSRLPGKVLRKLGDQTVLAHVIDRVRVAKRLDEIWVATTDAPDDIAIVDECVRLGIPTYRGSESDVLDRYFKTAQAAGAEIVVRITSDCPMFDGRLLDDMLAMFTEANQSGPAVDYLSNVLERTYPRGLDAEVFTFECLAAAEREATLLHEREHVTPFIYQHPERFRLRSYAGNVDRSGYRWTLDTPEDWQLVEALYAALWRPDQVFLTEDIVKLLKTRPELNTINAHVEQKKLSH